MYSRHKTQSQFLNQSELAARWKISPKTLERWRYEGKKPSFTKIHGRILYNIEDIQEFESECKVRNTSVQHLEDGYE